MKPLTNNELKWVSVDFDDVIASNSGLPDFVLGEPMVGAQEVMRKMISKGYKIIVYTARPWSQYIAIEDWLNTHQIPFKLIVCGKMLVKWMIDDRNVEFKGDWNAVWNKIK